MNSLDSAQNERLVKVDIPNILVIACGPYDFDTLQRNVFSDHYSQLMDIQNSNQGRH